MTSNLLLILLRVHIASSRMDEITKNGVSPVRPYDDIPEEFFVWNSNVIPRNYAPVLTKQV